MSIARFLDSAFLSLFLRGKTCHCPSFCPDFLYPDVHGSLPGLRLSLPLPPHGVGLLMELLQSALLPLALALVIGEVVEACAMRPSLIKPDVRVVDVVLGQVLHLLLLPLLPEHVKPGLFVHQIRRLLPQPLTCFSALSPSLLLHSGLPH